MDTANSIRPDTQSTNSIVAGKISDFRCESNPKIKQISTHLRPGDCNTSQAIMSAGKTVKSLSEEPESYLQSQTHDQFALSVNGFTALRNLAASIPEPEQDSRNSLNTQRTKTESILSNRIRELSLPESRDAQNDQEYLKTLEHIITSEKMSINDIPSDDLKCMFRALKFSEVSLNDQFFNDYNIKIIKTGPVFFTWYALKGKSIFNGKNNYYQYDYVSEIKEAAKYLEEREKPVIVVYSRHNMSDACILEMNEFFEDVPNIVTLCIETDLDLDFGFLSFRPLRASDFIRLHIIMHQKQVYDKAKEKSEKLLPQKKVAHQNLIKCDGSSFIYSDMDNLFKRYPDYILAFDGVIDAPKLEADFNQFGEQYSLLRSYSDHRLIRISLNSNAAYLSREENEVCMLVQKCLNRFKENSEDCPENRKVREKSNKDIMDCFKKVYRLMPLINLQQRKIFRTRVLDFSLLDELDKLKSTQDMNLVLAQANNYDERSALFVGDNGFLGSTPDNAKFNKLYDYSRFNAGVLDVVFHQYSQNYATGNHFYNPHFMKANHLLGYQLMDSIIIGRDNSWGDNEMTLLIDVAKNRWFTVKISSKQFEINEYRHDQELELDELLVSLEFQVPESVI